jgi:hypothetical protein
VQHPVSPALAATIVAAAAVQAAVAERIARVAVAREREARSIKRQFRRAFLAR